MAKKRRKATGSLCRRSSSYSPETGAFRNGCRVYIATKKCVGTVLDFEYSKYLVRYMNQYGVLETAYFSEDVLAEQPVLPFEELPF